MASIIPWEIWAAAWILPLLFTFAWLFIEERLYLTTLAATAGYTILYITGGNAGEITSCCATRVPLGGFQYLAAGLALISFFTMWAYYFDLYPPGDDTVETDGAIQ